MNRPLHAPLAALAALVALALSLPAAAQVLRVPADVGSLQQAFQQVAEGGVIELAPGTYAAPGAGFRITGATARKSFSVRAGAGGPVILTGNGNGPVLRFEASDPGSSGEVFFRGLTFENGLSTTDKRGGGVSLVATRGVFVDCVFRDNVADAPSTGGGGALLFDGATGVFADSLFENNSSPLRGGGLSVVFSTAYVQRSRFLGNRVNLPGHQNNAPGGGIYAVDSRVRVFDSHFEGNRAGWVGGAVYLFGTWGPRVLIPTTDALIAGSTFVDNRAEPTTGTPPGPTVGGAVHAEDHVSLRIFGSQFENNRAHQGGAVNGYRSIVEIEESILRGNLATGGSGQLGVGGAVYASSQDFADNSTAGGAVNRRAAELTIRTSLLQGRFGGTTTAADNGGCLFAFGDLNRKFGDNGVEADGSDAFNRTRVTLDRVIFADCDVQAVGPGQGGGGGAVSVRFSELEMTGSLVIDSDADPAAGTGGGVAIFQESAGTLSDTTFAGNSAFVGGALYVSGSDVEVDDCRFFDNEVSPGVAEPPAQSRGAAIHTTPRLAPNEPDRQVPVGGVVRGSLFSGNVGIPIFEIDQDNGPINSTVYNDNRFFNTSHGDKVFINILAIRAGENVAQLNGRVIQRANGTSTDKSVVANAALTSAPLEGAVLSAPTELSSYADKAPQAFLGAGWSTGAATLAGAQRPGRSALVAVGSAGAYPLRLQGQQVASASVDAESCTGGPVLCLNDDRYRLDLAWRFADDRTGVGTAVQLTPDTGYFFFFRAANVELVAKVLDAQILNGHFWLFYGAMSNVEYTLGVLDTETGKLNAYFNPLNNFASVGDTTAFPAGIGKTGAVDATGDATPAADRLAEAVVELSLLPTAAPALDPAGASGTCAPTPTRLCLQEGRFAVEMDWRDFRDRTGAGQAVQLTSDTGYFYFVRESNVEVILKVLDGRVINNSFWVFYGALSNVEYTLQVTDTVTGATAVYFNPLRVFASVGDTNALPGS